MAAYPKGSAERLGGFAEAPDEQARMGRISGYMWVVSALVGAGAAFLPGAVHEAMPWVLGVAAAVLLYGIGSVTGWIPWQHASMNALAFGMVATIPVVGVGLYLTGGSLSYIEPLLVCSLLYASSSPPTGPGHWRSS